MKSRNASLPTMRDVAARAGVSATAVSRVLSGKGDQIRVSEATAQRVRTVAEAMGYRLNVTAKQFRERRTLMIGVLHGVGFDRPHLHGSSQYFAALMDGIIDGAFDQGYSVTLCPKLLGQSPADAMADGRFDGLVWYSTAPSGDNRRMLEKCSIPLVLIHTPYNTFQGRFPTVTCDNDQGIGLAVDHLVSRGHRRLAFVAHRGDVFEEVNVRRDAFLRHLRRHGLQASLQDMVRIDPDATDPVFGVPSRYTAAVATSDGVAATLLEQAARAGVRIPEELSVVGFDSTHFCLGLQPRLTSVSQPLVTMGRRAVDLLIQTIQGEHARPTHLVLACGLDVRSSTCHPANCDSFEITDERDVSVVSSKRLDRDLNV